MKADTFLSGILGILGFELGIALLLYLVFSPVFLAWLQAQPVPQQVMIGLPVMGLPVWGGLLGKSIGSLKIPR